MIIGNRWDHYDFFLQIDVVEKIDQDEMYGVFNFWIDELPYPGKGVNITLGTTAWYAVLGYKEILNYPYDGSNLPLEEIDFEQEDNYFDETIKHRLCVHDFGELYQYGLYVKVEIVGETLRFFYCQNNGPWKLKEIPLAYYESIIKKLDKLRKENFKSLLDDRFNNIKSK